jgi:uncharacterized protein (DUF305 family)
MARPPEDASPLVPPMPRDLEQLRAAAAGCTAGPPSRTITMAHRPPLAFLTALACSTWTACTHGTGAGRPDSSRAAAAAPYDLQFIDTMKAHEEMAIHISRLAEDRAALPEVRSLAAQREREAERELERLQAWRSLWYAGRADAENPRLRGAGAAPDSEEMQELETAIGAEFDRQFFESMIHHNRAAAAMAEAAKEKATRPEIRRYADEVILESRAEIQQLRDFQRSADEIEG